jgi:hypothetical protein
MKLVQTPWIFSALLLVGCLPVTYQVKITNDGSFTTDFAIESGYSSTPTFVEDLASGTTTTVSHTGTGFLGAIDQLTVSSGTLIGGELTPIDAECSAAATANDVVTVVKAADGSLSCTVIAARAAAPSGGNKPRR